MVQLNANKTKIRLSSMTIVWVLIGMCIVMTLISPNFMTPLNIVTILRQFSMLGILAIGATFVLVGGGIDLSVGSTMALTGVCAALIGRSESIPLVVPILAAVLIGGAIGAANGVGVAYAKIPAFIMTLGFMISGRGIALILADGKPVFGLRDDFMSITTTTVFRIGDVAVPSLIFFFVAVFILSLFIINKTIYGKWVYGVGGNEMAARFSGINTKRIILSTYVINGLFAGLCGVLMASRINSGDATVADGYALDAISAAVIGGISLSGGLGKAWKAVIGAFIIGVLQNGLQIIGLSPFVQTIIQGVIIMVAVFFDQNMQRSNK